MKNEQLATALNNFTLAIMKLSEVVHSQLNDPLIHHANQAIEVSDTAETTNVVEMVTPTVVDNTPLVDVTAGAELDGENRPWIKGLHSNNKGQMASKEVKGAKKWKFFKGTSQADKDAYHAKYPLTNTVEASATLPGATLPGQTTTAMVPPGATLPNATLPGATLPETQVDDNAEIRKVILGHLQTLASIGLTWPDLQEMFAAEFNCPQSGDQVTLGGIPTEKYPDVAKFVALNAEQYQWAINTIAEINAIATPANKAYVDNALNPLFTKYQTTEVAGVHYTNLIAFGSELAAILATWQKWANDNKG